VSDAEQEPTYRGDVWDDAVERLRRRMQPAGADPDYDLVRDNFDVSHYLMQARYLAEDAVRDPVRSYFRSGIEWKRSPDLNFSVEEYRARYPELDHLSARDLYLHWLRVGRAAGEIADPAHSVERMAPILGLTTPALVSRLTEIRTDLEARLRHGKLGEMVAKAAEIEPLIGGAFVATQRPKIMPLGKPSATDQVAVLYACHEQADFRRARLLLVINRPRWGGSRRLEGHIAHALRGEVAPEDIVVVYTDDSGEPAPHRFPPGVREIPFHEIVQDVQLEPEDAERVLVELIRSFHAEAVVNVNSRLFYDVLRTYGPALRASERIFLVLLCTDQRPVGNWDGWPLRAFYRYWDQVAGVITDSHYLKEWLVDHHQMYEGEADRIHVFSAPVDPTLRIAETPRADEGRRPQVYWAGRWDRQKRIDLAFAIARRMPAVTFHLWCNSDDGNHELSGRPPANVVLHPPYADFAELDLDAADAWLYTSRWDGVPSQLLEVAMTGVPLVGSLVGGTGEVLTAEEAWPVAGDDPADYEAAIREVLDDVGEARRRSKALRERLIRERTPEAYLEQCRALLAKKDW
jgi:glycosyltransferase involved in cell wall biosynthesis